MNQEMNYGRDFKYMPATSINSGRGFDVLPDLYQHTLQIVNIVFYGNPDATTEFVLIDAGMPKSAQDIISIAEKKFGLNSKPKAIILTHGHFDHVGAIVELIEHWNVPVYAHPLELPYVTGQQNYPRPDPSVNGGFIAKMSGFFPHEAIHLGNHVQPLPANGTVPHMAGFRWIHTPGHTPGHVSLFRDQDRALIAGDAFVTVKQESLFNVLMQKKEMSGPPRYFTTDWLAAKESVKKLASLKPSVAITGHGVPMKNEELTNCLHDLANRFEQLALPKQGKYLN
ncbi:MAG: MBL fold metallo-hydrolase [Solibacillus sp.]